jgi:predicted permease
LLNLSSFIDSLFSVFGIMVSLFLIAAVGFVGIRRHWFHDDMITALTALLVSCALPAKIVGALTAGLTIDLLQQCALIIFLMITFNFLGIGLGWLATRMVGGGPPQSQRAVWAMSGLQNGVYLPLPMALALAPKDPESQNLATVYVAGAFVAMVILQWTVGAYLLAGDEHRRKHHGSLRQFLQGVINPPLVAIAVGAVLAFVPGFRAAAGAADGAWQPLVHIFKGVHLLGSAVEPVAMLVLGMMIGSSHLRGNLKWGIALIPAVIQMGILPAIMLAMLWSPVLGWVPGLLALVLIIEASTPPATNLSVVARRFDGDWRLVSASLFICYLIAMVAMPFWTAFILPGVAPAP